MSEFGGALDSYLLRDLGDDDSTQRCPACGEDELHVEFRRRRGGWETTSDCGSCGWHDEYGEPDE